MDYVLIRSAATSYALPEIRAKFDWICPGAPEAWPHPKLGTGSADVRLGERIHAKSPLNIVYRCRIGVLKRTFLERVDEALIHRSFHLGKVFNPDGAVAPNWLTFRGKNRVVVRGTKNPNWQRCEICGAVQYSEWGGENFLWPPPNPEAEILDDNGSQLVFRKDVVEMIFKNQKLPGLRVLPIQVAKAPLDGIEDYLTESVL